MGNIRIETYEMPSEKISGKVLELYRDLFGQDVVDTVSGIFRGEETSVWRDIIIAALTDDDRLAGVCMLSMGRANVTIGALNDVGVYPEFRRCGIAEQCCRKAMEIFDGAGGKAVFLATGNPAAAGLYRKLGFQFISGTSLMLRLAPEFPSQASYFRKLFPGGDTGELLPGGMDCRWPLVPLAAVARGWHDPLLDLYGYPIVLASSQGIYPRYQGVREKGGDWLQLRGVHGELVGVGEILPDDKGGAALCVICHPAYLDAPERLFRRLAEIGKERGWDMEVPVKNSDSATAECLEKLGFSEVSEPWVFTAGSGISVSFRRFRREQK